MAKGQVEVAAVGDFDGIGDGVGTVGKLGDHFLGGFDVELVGAEPPAVLVGHDLGALDAQQDFVGFGILLFQVMTVIGGNQGQRLLAGQFDQGRVDLFLFGQVIGLHLDIKALIKNLGVGVGCGSGAFAVIAQHGPGQFAAEAAGQGNQAAVEFAQQFAVHARFAIEAFGKAGGDEAAQVAVALLVHGQQNEMEIAAVFQVVRAGRLFVKAALGRNIHLAADDGLDAVAGRGAIEVDRAEHIAVVGHGHRGHAVLGHARHQMRDLIGPVQQAVLRV